MYHTLLHAQGAFASTSSETRAVLYDLDGTHSSVSEIISIRIRRACGLRLPSDTFEIPDPHHWVTECKAMAKSSASESGDFSEEYFLAYVSSFFHELRHSHDLLYSAYGQTLFCGGCTSYFDITDQIKALVEWQSGAREPIPIPLSSADAQELGLPGQIISKASDFESWQKKLSNFSAAGNSGLDLRPWLEMSAIVVQLWFLEAIFGSDARVKIINLIQRLGGHNTYLKSLADIVLRRPDMYAEDIENTLLYIVWCSLNSLSEDEERLLPPAETAASLTEYLITKTEEWDFETVESIVNEYYNNRGLLHPVQAMKVVATQLMTHLSKFLSNLKSFGVGSNPHKFAVAVEQSLEIFRSHAELSILDRRPYFIPKEYIKMYFSGDLPAILLTLNVGGGSHDFMTLGQHKLEYDNWEKLKEREQVYRWIFGGKAAFRPSFPCQLMHQVLNKGFGLTTVDKLFRGWS